MYQRTTKRDASFFFFSVHALLSLSKVDDHETLRLALQTLELVAIENPAVILANVWMSIFSMTTGVRLRW